MIKEKKLQRLLSILLALAMALSMSPLRTLAADAEGEDLSAQADVTAAEEESEEEEAEEEEPVYCYVCVACYTMPFTTLSVTLSGDSDTYEPYYIWNYDSDMDGAVIYVRMAGFYVPEGSYTATFTGTDADGRQWEGAKRVDVVNTYDDDNYWDVAVNFVQSQWLADFHEVIRDTPEENDGQETPEEGGDKEEITYVASIGENDYASLQAAIENAASGDTITLIADCQEAVINNYALEELTIDLNGHTVTAQDGRCITVGTNTNMTLRSLTICSSSEEPGLITGADGTTGGGISCVYPKDIDVTVRNIIFQNNKAPQGAAIAFSKGSNSLTALIEDCQFQDNSSTTGALSSFANEGADAAVTVRNCRFTGNRGGAIYADDTHVTIEGGSITENTASTGGGIYLHSGSLTIREGAKIYNNTAATGGDDIYIGEGAALTLPDAAEMDAMLEKDGDEKPITVWYSDHDPRWNEEYTTVTPGQYTGELFLKAAYARFTVTFDSNGGSAVEAQSVFHNDMASGPSPARSGYNFSGWYLGDALYDFNTPVTGDITLTAHWSLIPDDDDDEPSAPVPPVDIPDGDTPLTEAPEEEPPMDDIPDEEVPLAQLPDEDVPLADIPQVDVPLTGDRFNGWLIVNMLCLTGLAALTIFRKRDII